MSKTIEWRPIPSKDTFSDYSNTQGDAAAGEGPLQEALADTRAMLRELADAYEEAYVAAYESIGGQTWNGIEQQLDRWWQQKTRPQKRMSFV